MSRKQSNRRTNNLRFFGRRLVFSNLQIRRQNLKNALSIPGRPLMTRSLRAWLEGIISKIHFPFPDAVIKGLARRQNLKNAFSKQPSDKQPQVLWPTPGFLKFANSKAESQKCIVHSRQTLNDAVIKGLARRQNLKNAFSIPGRPLMTRSLRAWLEGRISKMHCPFPADP